MENFDNIIVTNNGAVSITDIEEFPAIDIHELQDIFLIPSINKKFREENFDTYTFYNVPVPRVSNILKECISKEYLMKWAASIGTKAMYAQQKKATTIGTIVHELIERYLNNDVSEYDYKHKTPNSYLYSIEKAFNNFLLWEKNLNRQGYKIEKIIGTEIPVSCPYYGGTIDCIMRINGANYIVDFKTSKSISFEYIIQTCAYLWIINNGYVSNIPYVDGIGIIRIDKQMSKFEDLFLNLHIPEQKIIIDQYIQGFGSLLYSYYNQLNMKNLFTAYKKSYNANKTLKGETNEIQ